MSRIIASFTDQYQDRVEIEDIAGMVYLTVVPSSIDRPAMEECVFLGDYDAAIAWLLKAAAALEARKAANCGT